MTPRRLFLTAALATIFALALALALCFPAANARGTDKEKWITLFNGKDLEGWTPKIKGYPLGENYADTFRVEDGVIKVKYDKYTNFD